VNDLVTGGSCSTQNWPSVNVLQPAWEQGCSIGLRMAGDCSPLRFAET
jgi:hypothetical protein